MDKILLGRRARNMSARMPHVSSLDAALRVQTRGRSYHPVSARVPFTWRVSHATPFSFGIPFPWEPLPSSGLLTVSREPAIAIHAPRGDGAEASFALWVTPDGAEVETADITPLMRQLKEEAGQRCLGIRKVSLSGARCRIIVAPRLDGHLLEYMLVNAGNALIEGRLVIPLAQAEGYLAHFDTMLGTWAWEP